MAKRVKFQEMLASLRRSLTAVPEHRKGRNIQYLIVQAGLGAFSVFFAQSPSFLAHQRHMEQRQGRNNASSIFGVEVIPSDGQTRNLLDPVDPSYLRGPFWEIYERLQTGGHLEAYESIGGTLLCSLDGTRGLGWQVDVVTCNASKSYWGNPVSCFDQIYRILKPGGSAIFFEPHKEIDSDQVVETIWTNLADKSWLRR